jgi:serine/threonine protein kinase
VRRPSRQPGTFIDAKYELVRWLGTGNFGEVWEARHRLIHRRVVLKLLHAEVADDPSLVRRFRNEARAAGSVHHPNIIAVTDIGESSAQEHYLVMEFCEGRTCEELLNQHKRLPVRRAVDLALQVCSGLEAAHAKNIVHRDLKPANLFVTSSTDGSDVVKILDFGIAKLRDGIEPAIYTSTGGVMGTPLYMSPEQARGTSAVDHRTDIYALGVILYEMLCGTAPFHDAPNLTALLIRVLTDLPVSLDSLIDIPPRLNAAVMRALSKDVSKRHTDMRELAVDLERCRAELDAGGAGHFVQLTERQPSPEIIGVDSAARPNDTAVKRAPAVAPAAHPTEPLPLQNNNREAKQVSRIARKPGSWRTLATLVSAVAGLLVLGVQYYRRSGPTPNIAEEAATKQHEVATPVASIPEFEGSGFQNHESWPKALALARLGDRSAREEVVPLLSDRRAAVRAEALRVLSQAHMVNVLPLVQTLADKDSVSEVRAEAALTAFSFGATEYGPRVRALLTDAPNASDAELDLARRAAFALAPRLGKLGEQVLFDLAADSGAGFGERERALASLGQARADGAVRKLTPLLDDVRLRPAVARAFGTLEDPSAVDVLLRALEQERSPEARTAEVEALVNLKSKRVLPQIVRFLGTPTGLTGGVDQWARSSHFGPIAGAELLDFRRGAQPSSTLVRGEWSCRARLTASGPPGCRPVSSAGLQLSHKSLPGAGRLVASVWAASSSEWLRIGERELSLHRGRNETSVEILPSDTAIAVQASANAFIELIGVVPQSPDLPPALQL